MDTKLETTSPESKDRKGWTSIITPNLSPEPVETFWHDWLLGLALAPLGIVMAAVGNLFCGAMAACRNLSWFERMMLNPFVSLAKMTFMTGMIPHLPSIMRYLRMKRVAGNRSILVNHSTTIEDVLLSDVLAPTSHMRIIILVENYKKNAYLRVLLNALRRGEYFHMAGLQQLDKELSFNRGARIKSTAEAARRVSSGAPVYMFPEGMTKRYEHVNKMFDFHLDLVRLSPCREVVAVACRTRHLNPRLRDYFLSKYSATSDARNSLLYLAGLVASPFAFYSLDYRILSIDDKLEASLAHFYKSHGFTASGYSVRHEDIATCWASRACREE